jgi:phage major head subunit gpT-like protein
MIINQATLQGIYRSFKVIFNQAFTNAKPNYDQVATVVPSSTREEDYKWLGKVPRMREWVGERVVQNLSAYSYEIKNKDWELTVAVDRNDIEDDTIGIYNPLVQMIGQSAAMHPDEIVFDLLLAGFNTLCYDGQYFFDGDHKDGDGPIQSNVSNKKLSADNYGAARAAMMSILDDKGNPLDIMPSLLVVPPQLEAAAKSILTAETINGTTNIYRNSAQLLVAPRLAKNPNAWFLMDTSKAIKPIIFQKRKPPEFTMLTNPDDQNVFMRKEYIYGVDCRDNAGYGLWQLAYGSTGEVA